MREECNLNRLKNFLVCAETPHFNHIHIIILRASQVKCKLKETESVWVWNDYIVSCGCVISGPSA